ncbi:MAG: ATP-binding cassette domain-containing protein [Candidatus Marinimicrobia bacterium]|nr:ATP-binding cassette domain-containing protein [Candidatus Neomarinimicrobiota bacterium]MCF7922385.1 ATP-binding cassette domain-containing protein [Candidatus Neomarinimicrobiota bacterium]
MKPVPVIEIKGLVTRFGERTILDNVDLDFYQNEVTVILGGSGSGKTTLLKSILGLVTPQAGEVKLFGQEFDLENEVAVNTTLQRIGVLFQNGALLNSISVLENLAIPLEQHTKLNPALIQRIGRVKLGMVGLAHAAHQLPSELSGGMRKRAALARSIALDPELLFCDEPSAGLDPITSAALDELILTLRDQLQMSIVVVTHELASIHRIADRIVFLDEGKILFHGSVPEAKKCGLEVVENFFKVGTFS